MKMLTLDQVAGELAVSVRTVRRWVDHRPPVLSFARLGRAIRVSRSSLDTFIDQRTRIGIGERRK